MLLENGDCDILGVVVAVGASRPNVPDPIVLDFKRASSAAMTDSYLGNRAIWVQPEKLGKPGRNLVYRGPS
jgi:ribosomal protein L35AE/L33A